MLELKITTSTTAAPGKVQVLDVTPDYDAQHPTGYGGENPYRADVGLVLAGTPILTDPYNPFTFLTAAGEPVTFAAPADGVVRILVAAVLTLYSVEDYDGLEIGQGYVSTDDMVPRIKVANGHMGQDPVLTAAHLLGVADMPVSVFAQTAAYALVDTATTTALGRLNLRYLQQPENQQAPLFDLYRRIRLQRDGAQQLFQDGRYLDACAVLLGAQHILITNGQTPDAYGPLLSGYSSAR
jgi:hypothetical protein